MWLRVIPLCAASCLSLAWDDLSVAVTPQLAAVIGVPGRPRARARRTRKDRERKRSRLTEEPASDKSSAAEMFYRSGPVFSSQLHMCTNTHFGGRHEREWSDVWKQSCRQTETHRHTGLWGECMRRGGALSNIRVSCTLKEAATEVAKK